MANKLTDQCIQKAEDDEPLFVLRAQDYTAPNFVRKWAQFNRGSIGDEKYNEAMACADDMEKWSNRKFPD